MYGNRYKDFANNTDIYYNGYITNWCAVKRSIILWNWFKNLKMVKLLSMWGEILYKRIRDLREDKDLLQKDLAKYLNCSQVCYSCYELGLRDIPTEVLIKLSKFYGVSIDYLLNNTDNPNPY